MRALELSGGKLGISKPLSRVARLLAALITWRADRFFDKLKAGPLEPNGHAKRISSLEPGDCALYIHIPFCHKPLCRFCCFVRYPYDPRAYREYMSALRREAEWLASTAEGLKVRAVYIGGGTPSIDVYALAELIDFLKGYYGGLEASVEANPLDIDDEAASVLNSASVVRLSIGVQTLRDWRLKRLGRLNHKVEHSLRAVKIARGKFKTLNIDMLWGAKDDTPALIRDEARRALELGVDQVTFYPLMPAPRLRRIAKRRKEGPYHPLEPQLYEAVLNEVLKHGYHPLTAWQVSRSKSLVDEYIIDYDKFLALGLSGIARLGTYAYVNTFNTRKYVELVQKRGFSAIRGVEVSPSEDLLYYLSVCLFGLKFNPGEILKKFGNRAVPLSLLVTTALRLLGEEPDRDGRYEVSRPATLYALHAMQQAIYMGVNSLREWGMRNQV